VPLYEYRCLDCGKQEERYAGMEEKLAECSACKGQMKRLITSKFHLHTDYASRDFVTTDLTGEPVRITSRKQERELCKEYGVERKEGRPAKNTYDFRVHNKLKERWI